MREVLNAIIYVLKQAASGIICRMIFRPKARSITISTSDRADHRRLACIGLSGASNGTLVCDSGRETIGTNSSGDDPHPFSRAGQTQ